MRRPVAIFFYLLFIAFSCTVGFIFVSRSEGWRTGYGLLVTLSLACFGIYGSLQELFGVEVIEWDGQLLRVQDKVSGFNRKREFDIDLMKNLRFGSSTYWQGNTYVMSSGRIQFEYRSKMESIGGKVNDDEAFAIVEKIRAIQQQQQSAVR